ALLPEASSRCTIRPRRSRRADSRQLSKAVVRGRLGPSRKARPSDFLRGQVPAHRQHRRELLITILKPIAAERLAALRRVTSVMGSLAFHQVSTSRKGDARTANKQRFPFFAPPRVLVIELCGV